MSLWRGLSTGRQVLLAGGLLLFIDLFLHWQQACGPGVLSNICVSRTGWHGIGILVGLLTLAMIAWEAIGAFGVDLGDAARNLPTALISAGLAAAVTLFTIIEFLTHNEIRHWPAWIGLILAIVIAIGGYLRFTESPAPTTTPAPTTPPPAPPPA
jgi:hypothetical protein